MIGFEIIVKGKGCHGAMANVGVDPLIALSNIHLGIQVINSREIAAGKFLVITVGQIGGGTTANVIPSLGSMTGTIRTYESEIREFAKKRITEIAMSIGKAYRCEVQVIYHSSCPTLINNLKLREKTIKYTNDLITEEMTVDLTTLGLGQLSASEDFAFVCEKVPGTMILLGATVKGKEVFPMHHPKIVFDESILYLGAAIYANSAISWLKENK